MQAAANLPDVQQQIQAMMTEQLQVATLRSQTKAKQSWKFMWVVLYYCTAIVGLVGIIYFGKGTTDTVNYGQNAVDLAKKHENYLVGYVNKSFSSIDTVVSSLINRPSSLCSSFINKDSDKFEKELERFISDVKLFNTTQVPLQKAFDLVEGDDGLLSVLGKLLFFPSDNANQLNYV